MEIRRLNESDARAFYECLKTLDQETPYMMYEPDERVWDEEHIRRILSNEESLLLGVFDRKKAVGFISADRGSCRRTRHCAYVVIGILKEYGHRGIGTELFRRLENWADENGITRLELTVEVPNRNAVDLYKKSGFVVEGTKKGTMLVDGRYVDEYMMARVVQEPQTKGERL